MQAERDILHERVFPRLRAAFPMATDIPVFYSIFHSEKDYLVWSPVYEQPLHWLWRQ